MKNVDIVAAAAIENGITETVNTYQEWKRLGFQVRKGSKALFKTSIWLPCKNKKSDDTDEENGNFFLKNSAFFGLSQVDKIA